MEVKSEAYNNAAAGIQSQSIALSHLSIEARDTDPHNLGEGDALTDLALLEDIDQAQMACDLNFESTTIEDNVVTTVCDGTNEDMCGHPKLWVQRWKCTCSACLVNGIVDTCCDVPDSCTQTVSDPATGKTTVIPNVIRYWNFNASGETLLVDRTHLLNTYVIAQKWRALMTQTDRKP